VRTPQLWTWKPGSSPAELVRVPFTESVRVSIFAARRGIRAPVLVPVDAPAKGVGGLVAVLFVPDAHAGTLHLDGARVGAGMCTLGHGAHLAFPGGEVWVSLLCAGEEEPYEPAKLGADRHCFRLKAKLKPGEPVVLCPGVPHAICGVVYRASAWRTARACANCGHDQRAPAWAPPAEPGTERRSLRELLDRAATRRA